MCQFVDQVSCSRHAVGRNDHFVFGLVWYAAQASHICVAVENTLLDVVLNFKIGLLWLLALERRIKLADRTAGGENIQRANHMPPRVHVVGLDIKDEIILFHCGGYSRIVQLFRVKLEEAAETQITGTK